MVSPKPLEGEKGCELPQKMYAIYMEKLIFTQSCPDTCFFSIYNFISVDNSSLNGITAPWCFYNVCSAGRDWCWAGSGFIKNKLRQPSRRWDREDKIHASAQLTIKPNYVWTGLTGHMLGSKFPDQEVTWEEALVYVCVYACVCVCKCGWSMCLWQKH